MNRYLAGVAAISCAISAAHAVDSADAARTLNTTFPEAVETELALLRHRIDSAEACRNTSDD